MPRNIVIIGAGIVGTSTADALSRHDDVHVTVLDRDYADPRGSTAYAPGFVGLYNETPVLTDLARTSAAIYDTIGPAFRRSGGIELATNDTGAADVERRVHEAQSQGLHADKVSPHAIPAEIAEILDSPLLTAASSFSDDGSTDVRILCSQLRDRATSHGTVADSV